MSYYKVLLHGTGIHMPSEEGDAATGFYTIRAVKATSAEQAVIKAKALVLTLWRTDECREFNRADSLRLNTEEVTEIGYWQARRIPNGGHVFY